MSKTRFSIWQTKSLTKLENQDGINHMMSMDERSKQEKRKIFLDSPIA